MPRSLSQPRKHLAFRSDTQCILQAAASQLSPAILVSPLHSAAPNITAIPLHLSHFQRSPKMSPSVPWPPATGVFATYPLQCHCAAIQYTITVSPPLLESDSEGKGIYTTLECDCTHCERKGMIACHPKLADVKFTQGLVRAVGTEPAGGKSLTAFCQRSIAANTTPERRRTRTGCASSVVRLAGQAALRHMSPVDFH